MQVELKHTWRINRNAWFIRLYLWVWEAKEKDITFCKLWWAYVFMWVGLPLRCVGEFLHLTVAGTRGLSRWMIGGYKHLRSREEPILERSLPPRRATTYFGSTYDDLPRGSSDVGNWLRTVSKKSIGKRRIRKFLPSPHLFTAQKPPFMLTLLNGIEHGALSINQQGQNVAFIIKCVAVGIAKKVGHGVILISRGAGALAACVLLGLVVIPGEFIVGLTMRASPLVVDVGLLIGAGIEHLLRLLWRLSWPLRKLLWYGVCVPLVFTMDLIGEMPNNVEKTIAIVAGIAVVGAYLAAPIVLLGVVLEHLLTHNPWLIPLGLVLTVLVVAIGLGMGWLISMVMSRFLAPTTYTYVIRPGSQKFVSTTTKTTVSFGRIMLIGFKSVKANTCPKVEIDE